MRKLIFATYAGAALALGLNSAIDAAEIGNPHRFGANPPRAVCETCHVEMPNEEDHADFTTINRRLDWHRFKQDGVGMCSACHASNRSHKVGKTIDFPIPADLPLAEDRSMTCPTCHYTHGRLDSDRPRASFSFMDRLLNPERLKKSFLLRRNNTDGELCLTCHNVN